jgi:hypothetical protein
MAGMGFFDDMPAPEPEPRIHHPWDLPEAELPGNVQVDTLLLGRTGRAAVAVTGISAYSAGFEIFLTARFRPGGGDAEQPPPPGPPGPPDPREIRRSLRFGLQLSDGGKVIGEHGGPGPGADVAPDGPILRQFMGGGSPRSLITRWWAWPLPPAGPLEFVCEWSALEIPETRASIDAQLILDAAAHSVQLWRSPGS